jgi:ABC-2 type transport system ATP-binding protein
MNNILEIQNLTKRFPKTDFCLKDISFTIPYGSIVGFVGENGAGKTTTMSCVLNTMSKDSGMVKLFGREMADGDTDIREDIGVVFDSGSFSGSLNAHQLSKIMQNVYARWDKTMYEKYLTRFKLSPRQKIKTYSKGMTMKLSIAVALSHSPKLLILDEATSGLDPVVRDEMMDVFLDFVQDENHSILLSSHITSDLEKVADYITFIHEGEIVFTAKKDDLIYKYGVMRLKASQFETIDKRDIIASRKRDYQIDALVSDRQSIGRKYKGVVIDQVSIDEIMLLLIKGENFTDFRKG